MTEQAKTRRDWAVAASGVALLLALWMRTHPYLGIWHDSVLYLGQTLTHLFPGDYAQDLYFAYGSQDRFSVFSSLNAWLIQHLGLAASSVLWLAVCQLAFIATLGGLLGRLVSGWAWWFGLVFVAVLPGQYGFRLIAYAEAFPTARSAVEPLCLLGLWLVWRRQYAWAALAGALAACFHPLLLLPALAVSWVFICLEHPRGWGLAAFGLAAPVLGLLDIAPFSHLFQRFDDEWREAVRHDGMLFLSVWSWQDWGKVAYDFVILLWAAFYFSPRKRQFVLSVVCVGAAGIALSFLGADILGNVLLTELQCWRALWLTHLFGLALTPFLIIRLRQHRETGYDLASWLLAVAPLAIQYPGGAMALALALVFVWVTHKGAVEWSPKLVWLVRGVCVAVILVLLQKNYFGELGGDFDITQTVDPWMGVQRFFSLPMSLLGVALLYFFLARQGRWQHLRRGLALGLGLGFVLAAGMTWDRRTPWERFVEHGLEQRHPFLEHIRPGSQVYWHGEGTSGVKAIWVLLRSPSYYSVIQSAGMVFHRATTMEYTKRSKVFGDLQSYDTICQTMNQLNHATDDCTPPRELVHDICAASPTLGYLVFAGDIEGLSVARWEFNDIPWHVRKTYYLYSCEQFKEL